MFFFLAVMCWCFYGMFLKDLMAVRAFSDVAWKFEIESFVNLMFLQRKKVHAHIWQVSLDASADKIVAPLKLIFQTKY